MPRDPEFTDLTTELEKSSSYGLCVLGSVGVAGAIGALGGGGFGAVVGAGVGLVYGLRVCPNMSPAIRHKLYSPSARMTPTEFRTLVRQFKQANPRLTTPQALDLIAQERMTVLGGQTRRA